MIDDRLMQQLKRLAGAVAAVMVLLMLAGASSAMAAASAWWHLSSTSWPATLPSSGEGTIDVVAENLGDEKLIGSPLKIVDRLPAGVTPQRVSLFLSAIGTIADFGFLCEISGQEVTCTLPAKEPFPLLSFFPHQPVRSSRNSYPGQGAECVAGCCE